MNRDADRERHFQDFLAGAIDEAELRRRLGATTDTSARIAEIEADLRAYRLVWESLERVPDSRLPSDFARSTARAALAERRPSTDTGDRWMAALVAGASTAAAASAGAAFVLLVSGSGLEVGRILGNALASSGQAPAAVGGTLGAGALLYALDRYLSRSGRLRGLGT